KNTGKGMKQETLEKIFTRFYQEDKHQEGSGIGLSLVKELAILHKGKIEVQSKPNEWTTFYVTIPVHKDNYYASEINQEDPAFNKPINQIHPEQEVTTDVELPENELPLLLIVEDNFEVQSLLIHIFNKKYNIIKAKNGEEGINLALKHIPDI